MHPALRYILRSAHYCHYFSRRDAQLFLANQEKPRRGTSGLVIRRSSTPARTKGARRTAEFDISCRGPGRPHRLGPASVRISFQWAWLVAAVRLYDCILALGLFNRRHHEKLDLRKMKVCDGDHEYFAREFTVDQSRCRCHHHVMALPQTGVAVCSGSSSAVRVSSFGAER
jgi:hypothetical protein